MKQEAWTEIQTYRYTMRFQEVSIRGSVNIPCSCGKRLRRQKKFWQTMNPYNKNKDGSVKTAGDILRDVEVERRAWAEFVSKSQCQHNTRTR